MAPLFEVATWATWHLAGARADRVAVAFVLGSGLAFATSLALVGVVIRREAGPGFAPMAAVAVFALASADGEVVNWYSASSFAWALSATLLAWLGAAGSARSTGLRRVAWLAMAASGAMAAPAFCAIGLLAGPLAALRALADDRPATLRRRAFDALSPISGMVAYLAACESFRYRDVLTSGVGRHVGWKTALWNIGRAPADVLAPGLLGIRNLDALLPDAAELAFSALAALALLAWAWRSRRDRALVLGGLGLIAGGYAATYGVRTLPDPRQVINVQRYHLFPELGLVFLLAPAFRAMARGRLGGGPAGSLLAANALALALLWAHLPQMKEHLRFFRFPEQPPTLAALGRLETLCRERGIARAEILAALDPIRPSWVPEGMSALEMFPESGPIGEAQPSADIRGLILAALSPPDRDALCGGMDASTYRIPAPGSPSGQTSAVLVRRSRVEPTGPGRYRSAGWPAFLEYQIGPEADGAMSLALSGVRTRREVELTWADADGVWSPNRSVWWRPDPDPSRDWSVPLDRIPHWRPGHVRRLRVYFHEPGAVALGTPRLLR